MILDSRIHELLSVWEKARGEGKTISPEDLCRDCPEVLDEVRKHIGGLESADRVLDGASARNMARGTVRLPGYELLGELGRGGMGVVYKARHLRLDRIVALKMILGAAHPQHETVRRFASEAQAIAQLQHPNIVHVYESGHHDGLAYFTMEFVSGGSLAEKLKAGPLLPEEASRLLIQLARGVQHAHEKGIVHRDLKPHNVLLGVDGTPKITDFGLAKRLNLGSGLTATGAIMGTPNYMAPEQASGDGKRVGPEVDVYGLGAILYECLTGRPPFLATTHFATLELVLRQQPVSLQTLQPGVPRHLEAICLKCLAKDPANRYRTGGQLAEELGRFVRGEPTLIESENVSRKNRRTQKMLILALVATWLVMAFLLIKVLFGGSFKSEGDVAISGNLQVGGKVALAQPLYKFEEVLVRLEFNTAAKAATVYGFDNVRDAVIYEWPVGQMGVINLKDRRGNDRTFGKIVAAWPIILRTSPERGDIRTFYARIDGNKIKFEAAGYSTHPVGFGDVLVNVYVVSQAE